MFGNRSNIVVLDGFRKPDPFKTIAEAKAYLETEQVAVSKFEELFYEHKLNKHTLKDSEIYWRRSLEHEQILLATVDFIENEIIKSEGKQKETPEALLAKCNKLIERNQRIKENITDDLESCRHYENKRDIFKLIGFALVTPLTVYSLVKACLPKQDGVAVSFGIGTAVAGTAIVFPEQTERFVSWTSRKAKAMPRHIRQLYRVTPNSFAAAALNLSVAAKGLDEIKPTIRMKELSPLRFSDIAPIP